jgi:hypothetical protein
VPTSGASKTGAAFTAYSGLTIAPAFNGFGGTQVVNHGQRPFAYTAPSGFKALCTQNLPTPAIGATSNSLATQFFDTNLYTGTSATQTIVNSGAFQPDWIWIKDRSVNRSHRLMDSVRGINKILYTDLTIAEDTGSCLSSINSNGFTLNTTDNMNITGETYAAWQWRAGNNAGASNSAGSITSTVSVNTTSGFSIVTYTGTGANATVGHGLGVTPSMVIVKNRTVSANSWCTWHISLISGEYTLFLDGTNAQTSSPTIWNSAIPTSTVFPVGTATGTNASSSNLVAYCFAPVAGFSAFGSYTGNGSPDGPFVYTGFRPAFLMIKRTDSGASVDWQIIDTTRDVTNVAGYLLQPNANNAESNATPVLDFLSNGFKNRNTYSVTNATAATYIYMAFASNPFKYSLAR